MDFNKGNISHNLRLLRIEVEFQNQPIARDATLRLMIISPPRGSHIMEIHIDGKIMTYRFLPFKARWDLDLLVNRFPKEAREVSRKFWGNVKDKVLQLVLPLSLPLGEDEGRPSSFLVQMYPVRAIQSPWPPHP
ncbi:hypothetical protein M406DRAFT_353258 [Cryphonectria parasitica EP155]|uniref:Uncharacterized protein n=1 Tax=Cryphonectria parasitica (strain ATCC 38755 / EP155) TaxID=660469 RepID=A0A9P4XVU9_CRYP1|nr:uncharacterized protein M406DRAFT_353258 [Cryphonectria parasitica EP155]KAF3761786.1 hypothetical protein M406DRAFT_353258 [Cryphonectria parasitica EP155]